MELTHEDAFLVLQVAYRSGLLEKLTTKVPEQEIHIPGTSFKEQNAMLLAGIDFDRMDEIAQFLAMLIDAVRKERVSNEKG